MTPFFAAVLATSAIGLISLFAFVALGWARHRLSSFLHAIVAFAAGGLLGGAFFHLLPEAAEESPGAFTWTLIGLLVFFVIDGMLWLYHCHAGHNLDTHGHGSCPQKPVGTLNLIADGVHNFTDGIIVASAFLVSIPVGIVTAIAVALHEIPQEIGDYGILLHSGFSHRKALIWNGIIAMIAVLGAILTFAVSDRITNLTIYTVPFAAGGFIYMACTNLLSEIKEEEKLRTRVVQFIWLLIGLGLLWVTKQYFEH
jgi:zinc and cadmium transporter